MNYQILEGTSPDRLSKQVNALIKSNYGTPIGGVTILTTKERDCDGEFVQKFFQAILTR